MARKPKPGADRWADIKGGMAFVVPVQLTRHESWRLMSPWAHKLVADLSTQYTGYNNGYLCAAWTLMKKRDWKSRTTLAKACAELEHYRVIERTQQGGRNRPNLYAFTWRRIDRIEGRPLDVGATLTSSNAWDAPPVPFRYSSKFRSSCPLNGLAVQLQAHQVDSVWPSIGLRNDYKTS